MARFCLLVLLVLSFAPSTITQPAMAQAPPAAPPQAPALHPELGMNLGHQGAITGLAFTPDGKTLVSGAGDAAVKVWDVVTGAEKHSMLGHDFDVTCAAASPDGRIAATGGRDSAVIIWDIGTGSRIRTLSGHAAAVTAVAFAPDGKTLASAGWDGFIVLWDLGARRKKQVIHAHEGIVLCLAFSPDGRRLASGGNDSTVRIWDLQTGMALCALESPLHHTLPFLQLTDEVNSVSFSPDGKTLATANRRGRIRLWDLASGEIIKLLPGHSGKAISAAFSPDGKTIASAGFTGQEAGQVRLWNAQTGALQWSLDCPDVQAMAFSPDGKRVACGGTDTKIRLFDAKTGKPSRTLGKACGVVSIAAAPDGTTLASGGCDGTIKLWDLQTGELKRVMAAHPGMVTSLEFSPDGRALVSVGRERTLKLWDVKTGRFQRAMAGAGVVSLAFSPDGRLMATGDENRILKLWDWRTGKLLREMVESGTGPLQVTFSPDGKTIAGCSSAAGWFWDVRTGVLQDCLPRGDWIGSIVFSPDSKAVVTRHGQLWQWDRVKGQVSQTARRVDEGNQSMAFSPDGHTLVKAGFHNLALMDLETLHSQITWGFENSITSVTYLPGGKNLAAGSLDGTIHILAARTGRRLVTLFAVPSSDSSPLETRADQYLAVTPEGYYTGSVSAARFAHFSLEQDSFPAECFQARYYHPDLVRQSLAGAELPPVSKFQGPYPPLGAFATPQEPLLSGNHARLLFEAADDSNVSRVDLFVNGTRIDDKSIKETGVKTIHPVDARPIQVGGRPLDFAAGILPPAYQVLHTYIADVPLPPGASTVKIQAVAFDNDGLQSPRSEILLHPHPTQASLGRLLGLTVGVSRYRDSHLNLRFSANDATALAEALNRQRGIYRMARVAALTDSQATGAAVQASLDRLLSQAAREDTVVLFLSGHGWRSSNGEFYFATYEVDRSNVSHTALAWSQILKSLVSLSERSKRVIILLDACHSGSAATNEELVKDISRANAGVVVFTSSRGSEVSLEVRESGHGAFTKALLEALAGSTTSKGRSQVSLWELASYVRHRVKQLTGGLQTPQIPFLEDFDTDAPVLSGMKG